MNKKIWVILMALWFFLWGALQITNITVQFAPVILGFLAILVGIFVLLDR